MARSPPLERQSRVRAFQIFFHQPRRIDHDKRVVGDDRSLIKRAEVSCVSLVGFVREAGGDSTYPNDYVLKTLFATFKATYPTS